MKLAVLTIAVLGACASPEEGAGSVALGYFRIAHDDYRALHRIACSDDRAAVTVQELEASATSEQESSAFDEPLRAAELRSNAIPAVRSTAIDRDGMSGTVTIAVWGPEADGTASELTNTIAVRYESGAWCVVTGWAELKRAEDAVRIVGDLHSRAIALMNDWKFNDVPALHAQAEAAIASLPAAGPERAFLGWIILEQRRLLEHIRMGWIGGHWKLSVEKADPMTDQQKVLLILASALEDPSALGTSNQAMLFFRCERNQLKVYIINTYDIAFRGNHTVSLLHRFGTAPAERIIVDEGQAQNGMFLRNPSYWVDQFRAHEADRWTVELPLHGRAPWVVTFELSGAGEALDKIPTVCR